MKKIFSRLLFVIITTSLVGCASHSDSLSGYYVLSSARTDVNAMYVGQVQMPIGFQGSHDIEDAFHACWKRGWSLPDEPDSETARYIFRIEPTRHPSNGKPQPGHYSIQNLGYGRYLKLPGALFHACPTTTMPEETFEILPSDKLAGHFTLHGCMVDTINAVHEDGSIGYIMQTSIISYLHPSADVNSVVQWSSDEIPSHWRLIPVSKAYADEAFRIFNPKAESPQIRMEEGHICEAPDVRPEELLSAIVSRYAGSPVFAFIWRGQRDASEDSYFCENMTDYMLHASGMLNTLRENGVKLVFVTDESMPVYDWLEIVKITEGDHYRVASLDGVAIGNTDNHEFMRGLYDSNGKLLHWGYSVGFDLHFISHFLESLDLLKIK